MTEKGSHSSSFILLLVVLEDPASDSHPVLFNISPSVTKVTCIIAFMLFFINFRPNS